MDLGLKDKVVVCLSSASSFAKGIATEFAREGAKVVVSTSEAFRKELDQAVADIEKETGNKPYAYTYDVLDNAKGKLAKKNCDLIVANDVSRADAGFAVDTNVVTLITPDELKELPLMTKRALADEICSRILRLRKA